MLWVTLLLATVLAVSRLFAAEREDGALDGVLLAPIDRTAIYLAKATALFLYLVLLEIVALPAFAILLLGPEPLRRASRSCSRSSCWPTSASPGWARWWRASRRRRASAS